MITSRTTKLSQVDKTIVTQSHSLRKCALTKCRMFVHYDNIAFFSNDKRSDCSSHGFVGHKQILSAPLETTPRCSWVWYYCSVIWSVSLFDRINVIFMKILSKSAHEQVHNGKCSVTFVCKTIFMHIKFWRLGLELPPWPWSSIFPTFSSPAAFTAWLWFSDIWWYFMILAKTRWVWIYIQRYLYKCIKL